MQPGNGSPRQGSRELSSGPIARLKNYALRHLQVFFFSLGRFYEAPLSSLLTATVIGIALALPTGLHILIENTRLLSGSWEGAARISVFLETELTDDNILLLVEQIQSELGPEKGDVITAEQALLEFRNLSGFGAALDALEENPLPPVLVVHPNAGATPEAVESLVQNIDKYPGVDMVQMDAQWLQRLHAILALIQRGTLVAAALFSLAVIIIVGNTIRLDIQNRREEILVIKLIGGTNAFIRRPFLYLGFWYGLSGSMMAWLLVTVTLWLIAGPVSRLAGLYGSDFTLGGLGGQALLFVFAAGALLGLLGAWTSVARHLSEIEPH